MILDMGNIMVKTKIYFDGSHLGFTKWLPKIPVLPIIAVLGHI